MRRVKSRRDDSFYISDTGSIEDPNLNQLKEEFYYTLNERDSSVFARVRLNHDTRYCVWPGQSEDGRKWEAPLGASEVFPWSGASDARVNLIDQYIRKHVAFLMVLWNKMRTSVQAVSMSDEAWARRVTSLLRWMKYTQMQEFRPEVELLANYLLERGTAAMGVFWQRQQQLQYEEVDLESLVARILDNLRGPDPDQRLTELPNLVLDPSREEEAAELMSALYPDAVMPPGEEDLTTKGTKGTKGLAAGQQSRRLESVVSALRREGYARFPRPVVVMDRPVVRAYSPNDDIFISPDAYRLEDASLFQVEVMREAKLRATARDRGWDPKWTEEMIATQRGNVEFGGLLFSQRLNRNASWLVPSRGQLDVRKLFLVVHSYRRLVNRDGVPGIYYTVFNPHLLADAGGDDLYARHELLNYAHGQVPYVLFQQERRSRKIDDSRGYGEVGNTWQNQVKAEWDNRVDRASIATLPPSYYPTGQQPDKWGPGVQVPTSNPQGYGFYQVTGDPAGSKEVEESVRHYADEYFGFAVDPENAQDSQMQRQKLADDWMAGHAKVDRMLLQLMQQFLPEDIYFRVVGSAQGKPIHCTREEIQGEFDLNISFDVGNMDLERVEQKLQLMQQLLGMDINGIIDHNEALVMAFEMIDPNAGERLLRPAENATQAEAEDELNTAVKLVMGIGVPVKPGQAYQLRLKVLTDFLQQNVLAQRLVQGNQQAQAAVQQRMKDLQFQVQQQQNAVTGRGGPNFAPQLKGK